MIKPIAGISSQFYLKRRKDPTVRHKKETFPGKTFTLPTKQEKNNLVTSFRLAHGVAYRVD